MLTAEQKARDLLERMEVPGAQNFTAGELVELANLITEHENYRKRTDELLHELCFGPTEQRETSDPL